jgi:hypothetical protein
MREREREREPIINSIHDVIKISASMTPHYNAEWE